MPVFAPDDNLKAMGKVFMADILELSVAERIQLVGDIWDSIAAHPETLVLTKAQQEELDRRLEDYRLHPEDGEPWEDVRREILNDL